MEELELKILNFVCLFRDYHDVAYFSRPKTTTVDMIDVLVIRRRQNAVELHCIVSQ